MKTRRIQMFHGQLPQNLLDKLDSFCDKENESYTYTGTLDNFEEKWGNKFVVMGEFIGITQYSSFGQR